MKLISFNVSQKVHSEKPSNEFFLQINSQSKRQTTLTNVCLRKLINYKMRPNQSYNAPSLSKRNSPHRVIHKGMSVTIKPFIKNSHSNSYKRLNLIKLYSFRCESANTRRKKMKWEASKVKDVGKMMLIRRMNIGLARDTVNPLLLYKRKKRIIFSNDILKNYTMKMYETTNIKIALHSKSYS